MNEELIKDALNSALYLLSNEYESVVIEELKQEYLDTIQKIELAIKSIEENG